MNRTLMIAVTAILFVSTLAFLSPPPKVEGSESMDEMAVGVNYCNTASTFLNRDAPLMHEAGIKIVRLLFTPYAMRNTLASLVPAIINSKLQVLGVLYNLDLLAINDINGWGDWVYSTVSAYKNYVKVWEVWNEPDWNSGFAPNGQVGDVVKYTQWLKAAYPRAKQADPTCRILGGSISVMQDNTLAWLGRMYDNGAQAYMDALSVHPYSNTSPLPPAQTSGGKAFWRVQDARNIMVQRGGANKLMWITEVGWKTSGSGVVVTEALQAQYLKNALTYAKTNWSWLETFVIYQWQDGGGFYFGLLRGDGSRKPSFNALKEFNSQTNSFTLAVSTNVPVGVRFTLISGTSTQYTAPKSLSLMTGSYKLRIDDTNVSYGSKSYRFKQWRDLQNNSTDTNVTKNVSLFSNKSYVIEFEEHGRIITSITWVPSNHVDVIQNIKYKLLNGGVLTWESPVIPRVPVSGQLVPPPYKISVPNIAADTLVLTATDVELTGHKIVVNDSVTLGEVQVHGDNITFTQSFIVPTP